MRISVGDPLTLEQWEELWIRPLVDLVGFGIGSRIELDGLTALLYADASGRLSADRPHKRKVDVTKHELHLLRRRRALPKHPPQSRDFMMPAGARGHTGFGGLIRRWFDHHRLLEGSSAFFFGTINAPRIHLETRLLNLQSFAETYHRRRRPSNSPIPKARPKEIRTQVLALLTDEERKVYGPRIDHAHEQSQRSRTYD